ncbi:MAG: Flp family type IVb pilin [Alphaproteobacteria bacterium]|nr:Flp family type IVb pilin [Alphaproteobacteria bacterium]
MDFLQDEDGATAIEYAILGSLIAVVIVVAVTSIGSTLNGIFVNVGKGFDASK